MKKLITLALAILMCLSVCACTAEPTDTPAVTTDGVSDTATETEADTAPETEISDDKFVFDIGNESLVWADYPVGSNADTSFGDLGKKAEYGKLLLGERLREAMKSAGEKRIAVCYFPEEVPEGADPFAEFGADYKNKYGSKLAIGEAYAMTAEEINSLVCDSNMKVAVDLLSYAEYYLMHTTYYGNADCGCGVEHPLPERYSLSTDFVPTEDNVIFGDESDNLLTGDGMTSLMSLGYADDGKPYVGEGLKEAMQSAGDKRIAATVIWKKDSQEIKSPFSDIGSEYAMGDLVWFLTADEIEEILQCCTGNPEIKLTMGILDKDDFEDYSENN